MIRLYFDLCTFNDVYLMVLDCILINGDSPGHLLIHETLDYIDNTDTDNIDNDVDIR